MSKLYDGFGNKIDLGKDVDKLKEDLAVFDKEVGRRALVLTKTITEVSPNITDSFNGYIPFIKVMGNSDGVGILNYETGKYEIHLRTTNRNLFDERKLHGGKGIVIFNGHRCLEYTDGGYYGFTYEDEFEEGHKWAFAFQLYRPEGNTKNVTAQMLLEGGILRGTYARNSDRYSVWSTSEKVIKIKSAEQYNQTAYLDLETAIILKDEEIPYYETDFPVVYSYPLHSEHIVELDSPLYQNDYCTVENELKSFDSMLHIENFQKAMMEIKYPYNTELAIHDIVVHSGFNKYYAIGDSITLGSFGNATGKQYWTYPQILCHIPEVSADGINSSCISTGDGNTTIESNAFIRRLQNIPEDADLISIFGGYNDFYRGHPLGAVNDTSENTNTVYGALKYICEYLLENHNTKTVFFITPMQAKEVVMENRYLEQYANAVKEVCGLYSIPCLDLYHTMFYPTSEQTIANYFLYDGVHPTVIGHEKIGKRLSKFILNELIN